MPVFLHRAQHDASTIIRTTDQSFAEMMAVRTNVVPLASIGEDRTSRYRRPCAHAHADRIRVQESADPARMTGKQPDPPRTGRGEMACRRMPVGRKRDVRAAMSRITAIAACGPRRVMIDHFSTPFAV
ncbi:hypothetical protein ABXK61_17225 [Burkholderia sola]|uniref:hypothetical protein n=1 Tax=Burkholderia TaxID=32008 RepID=UPI001AE68169|nr:hypothetical protein [Burkholderia sp. AcTa6-5]MBP0715046.1 hypothetical protein [Burkholderia sp. AcTa6-5]